jgi:putative DNA primase/helicase
MDGSLPKNEIGLTGADPAGCNDSGQVIIHDTLEIPRRYSNELSHGFYLHNGLLMYQVLASGGGKSAPPVHVCSELRVLAITRDHDGHNHGRLVSLMDSDGRSHEFIVPMTLLAGDQAELLRLLLSRGLVLGSDRSSKAKVAQYLMQSEPHRRVRVVSQTGWHGTAFVLPGWVLEGINGEELAFHSDASSSSAFSLRNGAPEGIIAWQNSVSRLAVGNSRLILALSLAFAPPLLSFLRLESGGFHLRGGSSCGKTVAARVANSVWGTPKHLQRWRATSNGLEGVASSYNHTLLVLDEIAQIDPEEAAQTAYMLGNETGKVRADRNAEARSRKSWKLLFLSTGEISLETHLMSRNKRMMAGQEVRVIDVPAEVGEHGIFEKLHEFPSGEALAEALEAACSSHHGVAAQFFLKGVQMLVCGYDSLAEMVEDKAKPLMEAFIKANTPDGASAQVKRVLKRFAIAAAAGELATELGVTLWPEGEASRQIARCFADYLSVREGIGPKEEKAAVEQITQFFQRHEESRFSEPGREIDRPVINRAGYRRRTGDGWEFFVFKDVFKKDICAGLDSHMVERVGIRHGLIMPESGGGATRSERLEGNKTQRVYRFTSKVLLDGWL